MHPEPDDLFDLSRQLGANHVLQRVEILASTGSTNDVVRERARAGEPEGLVVVADRQTAGRGRLGREWYSPPGVNLYLSFLLRPPLKAGDATCLPFLAALALARAVETVGGVRPGIKWPNDLVHGGKKLAGILIDLETSGESLLHAVVGVGVNVKAQEWPEAIRHRAASIEELTGRGISRAGLAAAFLAQAEALYREAVLEGRRGGLAAWETYDVLRGETVRVATGDRVIVGTVRGYDGSGAMWIELPDGEARRVLAGEVERVRRTECC
ncbi:MAG: biotin--[acetyl-CoA-carboxylase] ligase [Nitrospirae bacterium]|nr:biotin--[acetyl-CoA-carboxylase] ligase [Nitrospirota bacterium]